MSPRTVKEPGKKTSSPSRERDPLFDALAIACGFRLDAITNEAARLCGVATAEIRKAGGTPEAIVPAVVAYRRLYPDAAVTPKAIANHWPRLVPKEHAAAPCRECGVGGGAHAADCSLLEGGSS